MTGLTVSGSDTANANIGKVGDDVLRGGGGEDRINGKPGAISLTGGAGDDKLGGGDLASVTDFTDLQVNHLRQVGVHVVLDVGGGDLLTLRKTLLANLDAVDFLIW